MHILFLALLFSQDSLLISQDICDLLKNSDFKIKSKHFFPNGITSSALCYYFLRSLKPLKVGIPYIYIYIYHLSKFKTTKLTVNESSNFVIANEADSVRLSQVFAPPWDLMHGDQSVGSRCTQEIGREIRWGMCFHCREREQDECFGKKKSVFIS